MKAFCFCYIDIPPSGDEDLGKLKGQLAVADSGSPRMGGEDRLGASESVRIMIVPGCHALGFNLLLEVTSGPHLKLSILRGQKKYNVKEYWALCLIQLCLLEGKGVRVRESMIGFQQLLLAQ